MIPDDMPGEVPSNVRALRPNLDDELDFEIGDHVELARALLKEVDADGPGSVHADGNLYNYDPKSGLWKIFERADQSKIVQAFSGSSVRTDRGQGMLKVGAKDVGGAIKLAADRATRKDFFDHAPKGLAFANGFVKVTAQGVTLHPHSPNHRVRYGYPFAYDDRAPVQWLRFLDSLFRDDVDKQDRVTFIHEFFGACLLGIATTHQRCLVGIGAGANGKSTLGQVILEAMPKGSTCSIAPQKMDNEYRRAKLAGKLLNVVSELPEADILESESFKAIIAGDQIDARHIRQSPFDFNPQAGHYFAANRLPGSTDTTHAFWRRFVVLPFTRSFREGDPDRDPHMAAKLIRDELPAIVSDLLRAGSRLMGQTGYTIPASHEAALRSWKRAADQVAQFVDECTTVATAQRPSGAHDWATASALYSEYRRWADDAGHRPPMAKNKFCSRLTAVEIPRHETKHGSFYALRIGGRVAHSVADFSEGAPP